jgi:integrase
MPKSYKYTRSFTFDGRRYFVRADTEKELYEKVALKKRDLEEGRVILSGSMTVKAWAKQVLEAYKPNISDEYRSQMEQRISKHILSDIGSLPLRSVKPLQCQAILNRQTGRSKSHIDKLYHELYFIFEKAVSNQLILKNPAADLVKPEGYDPSMRSLTPFEKEHWESIMDDDPRFLLFQLMYYCGCRPSEAANVLRTDFSTASGYPKLHIRGTKTKNSDRYVPVPLSFWNKVRSISGLIAPNNAGKVHDHSSYYRLSDFLRRSLNISMGCKMYRNALIPPYPLADDFVPYMFRHTYCTNLQKAGVDIRTARDLMGHADISTTANIYTHQDEDTMETAARLLGSLPPKGVTPGATSECI